jgi:putative transposase
VICPLLSGPKSLLFWTVKEIGNASKKHKPEEIIGKLREAEIVLAQGGSAAEACRRIAVSEQTYYRWRKEYGGLKTDQARRMKDLEKENGRLRRAISDLTLDKLNLSRRRSSNGSLKSASRRSISRRGRRGKTAITRASTGRFAMSCSTASLLQPRRGQGAARGLAAALQHCPPA